ncbi:hypothetical protein ABT364_07365 [Massilia sp. SR12]
MWTIRKPENIMKALRNFEALFVAIIGLACAANYVFDGANESAAPATYAAAAQPAANQSVPVVVVAAKRMSAAEKQASLAEERKAAQPGSI